MVACLLATPAARQAAPARTPPPVPPSPHFVSGTRTLSVTSSDGHHELSPRQPLAPFVYHTAAHSGARSAAAPRGGACGAWRTAALLHSGTPGADRRLPSVEARRPHLGAGPARLPGRRAARSARGTGKRVRNAPAAPACRSAPRCSRRPRRRRRARPPGAGMRPPASARARASASHSAARPGHCEALPDMHAVRVSMLAAPTPFLQLPSHTYRVCSAENKHVSLHQGNVTGLSAVLSRLSARACTLSRLRLVSSKARTAEQSSQSLLVVCPRAR